MIATIRSWRIARQIALLIAAALLLLSAGNMLVTFIGPPPRAAPFRLDDMPALLRDDAPPPPGRTLSQNDHEPLFRAREGEARRPEAEARLAQLLHLPVTAVQIATTQPPRAFPGPGRIADHLDGDFSIGVLEGPDRWHILRSVHQPWFTAWHRTTLILTLALAALLTLIAAAITRGIVHPIRRLAREADEAWLEGKRGVITIGGPPEVAHLAGTIAAMRDRFVGLVENRTTMLAAIAHDMASPLARLEFHVAKLPAKARSEAEADLAELSAMIASILGFAKGQQGLERSPVDLAALAREVATRYDNIGISAMPAEAWVLGDRVALRRLIDNLANNARRYAGGGIIEIAVEGGQLRLVMLDDGPGFDPALAERLFDPFFRVETSRNRDTAGTGLGLATARAIADAHGGNLEASNRSVAGASFVLTLALMDVRYGT